MGFAARFGWLVFAVLSGIVVLFGVGDIAMGGDSFRSGEAVLFESLAGRTWDEVRAADPGAARVIDQMVRATGANLLVLGLLSLVVSLVPLRRGDRWAWWAMWVWPLWVALVYVVYWIVKPDFGAGLPVPLVSGSVFLVIAVLTLVISYRRYTPRAPADM